MRRTWVGGIGGFLSAVCATSICSGAPAGTPAEVGAWSGPIGPWPLTAVHGALLETGKVLHYGYTAIGGPPAAYGFDPDQPLAGTLVPPPANHFCGGGTFLFDGTFLAIGGSTLTTAGGTFGIAETSRFDPFLGIWIPGPDLQVPRWYPTATALPDGRILASSGLNRFGIHTLQLERFTPGAGWEIFVGADQFLHNYPFFHLAPTGKIFHSGPEPYLQWFDPGSGAWTFVGFQMDGPRHDGCSVLLPPLNDRVLLLGGGNDYQLAKASAEVWIFQGGGAAGHLASPMASPRANASAVLPPTQNAVASVSPPAPPALGGGPLTIQGSNFANATAVSVAGQTLAPPDFAVTSPSEIEVFVPPIPPALGAQPVTVTTPLGTSAPGTVEYVANDPPVLQAPAAVSSPGSFDASWAGLPGDPYYLLFWIAPTTVPLLGQDLLDPHIRLQVGTLPASNGFGTSSFPVPPGVPAATFATQCATLDLAGPTLRVSAIRSTAIE